MYRLRKALYGLKQAPRAWYNMIDAYLLENGFDKCDGEPTLCIKENDEKQAHTNSNYHGVEVEQRRLQQHCQSNVIQVHDRQLDVLIVTRSDIMYAMSLVSRFMETPKETHWQVAKTILRNVNGKKQYGVLYTATNDFRSVGYADSDWAGSVDDKKSTSVYVSNLGSGTISWASKK
eukprot:PITA_03696